MWGWEPTEHHALERDEHGVITGVTVTRDPEFSAHDRALLAAWQAWDKQQSPRGFQISEEISPLADPDNPAGTYRFVADELPIQNHAEIAEQRAREAYRKAYTVADEEPDLTGLHWTVHKIERNENN